MGGTVGRLKARTDAQTVFCTLARNDEGAPYISRAHSHRATAGHVEVSDAMFTAMLINTMNKYRDNSTVRRNTAHNPQDGPQPPGLGSWATSESRVASANERQRSLESKKGAVLKKRFL